jgi:hypothetical protein
MLNNVTWSPGVTLAAIEKQAILAAFRHFRGNKTATANSLGIAIRTLDNKLEQYKNEAEKEEKQGNDERTKREEFLQRQRGFTTNADGSIAVIPGTKRDVHRLQGEAKGVEQGGENGEESETGLRMESASGAAPELPVSLPLGQEVQSVSSKHAAGNRNGKRR